ncbi:hypothetical protein GCM10023093_10800 [Nemorincola caseinilytica]|uniref:HTH merR-type domain-containing protein n=1 Tax=Nemorincola caseinilytica TaxID=2054315 RepID=A0ABP8NAA5_9BACT
MSTRIVTLFGEEIVPGPQKPAAKTRGKKDKEATKEEPGPEAEQKEEISPEAAPTTQDASAGAAPQAMAMPAPEAIPQEAEPMVSNLSLDELGVSYEYMAEAILQKEYAAATEATQQPVSDTISETTTEPIAATTAPQEETDVAIDEADAVVAEEAANIIPEDWKGDKNYYSIGEVASFFSVKTSHIRFWTNEFKLKVRTTRKGDRLYTPDQVRELRAIYHLVKERGFTLSGAKTRLKEQNKREVATISLKDSLLALRSKLQILRDQL